MKKLFLSLCLVVPMLYTMAQPGPCNCDFEIDPVCVLSATGDVLVYPNVCWAECDGFTTSDLVDCDSSIVVGPPNPGCHVFFTYTINPDNPLEVQFEDLSDGNPTSWHWDFGDGNTSTEQNPLHEYDDEGVYEVILDVTTDSCAGTFIEHICLIDGIIIFPPDSCGCTFDFDPVCVEVDTGVIFPYPNECWALCDGYTVDDFVDCDSTIISPPNPCNCDDDFDPVCVEIDPGVVIPYPSACWAECDGFTSDQFVNCDTIIGPPNPCNCTDEYDPVCVEIDTGLVIPYPNACWAECDGFTADDFVVCDSIIIGPPNPCNCNDDFDPVCVEIDPGVIIPYPSACWAECDGFTSDDFVNCDTIIGPPNPCNCTDEFDPVCVEIDPGVTIPYPNACWAECDGFTADDFVDCDSIIIPPPCVCTDEYDPVCVEIDPGIIIPYHNACVAECDGYTPDDFVSCDSIPNPCNCPMVFEPVCIIDPAYFGPPFDNACLAECAGFTSDDYVLCDSIGGTPPTPCGCTDEFDPVCVEILPDLALPFPNACWAECAGFTSDDFVDCDSTLIIQNLSDYNTLVEQADFEVNVHPNPPINKMNIQIVAQAEGEAFIQLMDLSGRVMQSNTTTLVKGFNRRDMDVQSLQPGIYFLQVQHNGKAETMKIVKP